MCACGYLAHEQVKGWLVARGVGPRAWLGRQMQSWVQQQQGVTLHTSLLGWGGGGGQLFKLGWVGCVALRIMRVRKCWACGLLCFETQPGTRRGGGCCRVCVCMYSPGLCGSWFSWASANRKQLGRQAGRQSHVKILVRAGRQQRPRCPPALLLSCCDTQEHACNCLAVSCCGVATATHTHTHHDTGAAPWVAKGLWECPPHFLPGQTPYQLPQMFGSAWVNTRVGLVPAVQRVCGLWAGVRDMALFPG